MWRVHVGFIADCRLGGEGGGGVAGSCWLHCRPRFCRKRGRGRGGGFLLASLKTKDGGFLLASL